MAPIEPLPLTDDDPLDRPGPSGAALVSVVALAVACVQGVDGASLATRDSSGRFETLAAHPHSAGAFDRAQFHPRAGPTVTALTHGGETRGLLPDERWEGFSAAAGRLGLRSVLAVPLPIQDHEPLAALTLYSCSPQSWRSTDLRTARLLARQAGESRSEAARLSRAEETVAHLQTALDTRTVIAQAQGILIARQGVDPDGAFDILRRASQRTNRKLREVAADIVTGAAAGERPEGRRSS